MKIRLLHFITELSTGGAQVALLRLIERLDCEKYNIQVACLYNGDREIAVKIRALGIPVTDLGMRTKLHWGAFIHLLRLLLEFKPHILHTWMFHANLPGRILGRMARVPIIISSERTMGMENHWRLLTNYLTGILADRIVCVSQNVAFYAQNKIGLPKEKLIVIPNGIDPADFNDLPNRESARENLGLPGGVLVGSIGRAQKVKGFDILIKAFQHVSDRFPEAILIIAGGGPELKALQEQSRKTQNPKSIIFLENVDETKPMLASLDIYVQPSRFEGMPNAVLEAMAAGLPVVATTVGGIPDIIQDGITGILVPSEEVNLLSDALIRMILEPDLRLKLAQAGQEYVCQHFTIQETAAKTETVYTELISTISLR
jgi:glycosyltransferase involved in cell wall biosynthesis